MSFGRAWLDLGGEEYKTMRSHGKTPLHLEPCDGPPGKPTAYRLFGHEHEEKDAWLNDVLTLAARYDLEVETKTVRLPPNVSWWAGFPRDICFLFHNLFIARGRPGLDIDDELVSILRAAQPDRRGVDHLAIFGLDTNDNPDGRRGSYLELPDSLAVRFVKWLEGRETKPLRGPGERSESATARRGSVPPGSRSC